MVRGSVGVAHGDWIQISWVGLGPDTGYGQGLAVYSPAAATITTYTSPGYRVNSSKEGGVLGHILVVFLLLIVVAAWCYCSKQHIKPLFLDYVHRASLKRKKTCVQESDEY